MSEKLRSIDGSALEKVAKELADFPKEIKPAIARAVNRTMSSAVTQMKREVTKEYTVKQKDVAKAIKTTRATTATLTSTSVASGGQVALYKFKHTPSKKPPKQRYKQPVKAQVKKSGGKKVVLNKAGNKAFIQTFHGNDMIFARKGKSRYPIEKLFSISVPQMISDKNDSKGSITRIRNRANEILVKTVDQEIKYRINKVAKKAMKGGNK